jgi:hypothetical protein
MSQEDRARSVLNLLIDHILNSEQAGKLNSDPLFCPNCDGPVESLSGHYCSESCRDQAAFVRQFRAAVGSGSILTPEKQVVFGERLWWLLGGGLPLRESRIPVSAKRQVAKRSGGKCETCGADMTTVENFGSGCNRPLHLRAVCAECSQTKPIGDFEFGRSARVVELLSEFARRIGSVRAIRECDDPVGWDWRGFMARRKDAGT